MSLTYLSEQQQKAFIERIKNEFSKLEWLGSQLGSQDTSIRFLLIENIVGLQITVKPSTFIEGELYYLSEFAYGTKRIYLTSERELDLFINNTKQILLSKFQGAINSLVKEETA